ncbi:MAG: hypothetical protein DWQ05_14795 [Calditrichaeota bacterium]|nr:MAG: hypothetical protein DWQ05_14795 [Calditrichota bacterium]
MNINSALTSGNLNSSFQSEQVRAIQETPAQHSLLSSEKKEELKYADQLVAQTASRAQEEGKGERVDISA